MTQKNNRAAIDRTRGSARDQRAINRTIKRGDVAYSARGLTREQRAIQRSIKRGDASPTVTATGITTCRRKKRQQTFHEQWRTRMERYLDQWFLDAADDEEQFGCNLADKVVSDSTYEEKPFGDNIVDLLPPANDYTVSLALFDGAEMLFACSGITLPHGPEGEHVTRFVTSKNLVTKFNAKRNKDDKLRIEVRLPSNRAVDGFLGLYDRDIAIVTSFDFIPDVCPVNLDCQLEPYNLESVVAFGRAFKSGQLMSKHLQQTTPYPVSDYGEPCKVLFPLFTEAALGASLTCSGDFCGMIHNEVTSEIWSLPPSLLRQRLLHFGVLMSSPIGLGSSPFQFMKGEEYTDNAGSSSGGSRSSRHKYSLPDGVETIVPSGFLRNVNLLKSMGYPTPPPLMLEVNGKLLNTFEDDFCEVSAWEGYDCNLMCRCAEYVWHKLPRKVFTDISRRDVSVVSFKGEQVYFACTGLLISWHARARTHVRTSMGTCMRMRTRSVILTSASLVRSPDDVDEIDKNLRIEVFLPPQQRADGRLELYHLDHNIAIISVEKHFLAARPENIFYTVEKPSKNVVAIGREAAEGLLLATLGEVTDMPRMCPSELDCADLKLSTCKIKKVGIGGPLINSDDGSLVGMNFYDDTDETPFLPRCKIVDVLKGIDLPSRSGLNSPVNMMNDSALKKNRWPVPEAYWYHPLFDKDWDPIPPHVGRVLQ